MHSDPFEKAAEEEPIGPLRELWDFLRDNKKWWLLPIVAALLAFGALTLVSGTAAAPLIYTFF